MVETSVSDTTIAWRAPAITQKQLDALREATGSRFSARFLPTFPTVFRHPEFEWLDRQHIDMRNLLHTDQEYEYRKPFEIGDTPEIRTRISDMKERSGMKFITLESDIVCGGEVKLVSRSTFIVRDGGSKEKK